ncbi:choloylglycine hydrolase [Lactobacillus ultunensis]|uniref:choloylglycine hydrolase n=1 Tax=Lactobacillus ultunensis DSM 16047 TaxID=525365 RepID=C2EMP6_9LACO|nr:choloylglycine hydrolase [Lactobacillus ultunensis]EEJ72255.1 linear amide C-N hydrolase, choloylglycine hydrolase family protein [Lactobacillus ultunensis DSM 16047]KRL82898.1 bile salt hydrolase [Lactobacillus ultunensis DSM 16047]
MCTSIIFSPKDHYFGRNLDLEVSFGQQVIVTPRNYNFKFRKMPDMKKHFAMVGIALNAGNYPLYFDAANEKGLGMAGLNYPGNATYYKEKEGKDNIASFEFVPWVLGQCSNISEVKELLKNFNIIDLNFSDKMEASPLHWLIADKSGTSIVVETDKDGMHIYDNPVGCLTNNPQFSKQLFNLNNYADISPAMPKNNFSDKVNMDGYSRGLGSRNLPGGMDSESRFVRVAFNKFNAPHCETEEENVDNYFHILHSVEQQRGLDQVGPDAFEYTIYSDGTNLDKGIFYYTTYTNKQINVVDMNKEDLDSDKLITYELLTKPNFNHQN